MIEHPQFPFPGPDTENFSEAVERAAWMILQELYDDWISRADHGEGTSAMRDAAQALRPAMDILARDIGRRKMIIDWISRDRD